MEIQKGSNAAVTALSPYIGPELEATMQIQRTYLQCPRPERYRALRLCQTCYMRLYRLNDDGAHAREERARRARAPQRSREIHRASYYQTRERYNAIRHERAKHRSQTEDEKATKRARNQRRRAILRDAFVADVDWRAIWERDGRRCQMCLRPLAFAAIHRDHIWPVAKGGDRKSTRLNSSHIPLSR